MLAPEFLPVWGGVGTYIVELVRHLPKDVEVHVVTPWRKNIGNSSVSSDDYNYSDYFGSNVKIHRISKASDTFFYNSTFQFACLRAIPKLIKEENIEIIHSHTAHMPDILLQFKKIGIPTITTIHTTIQGQHLGSKNSGFSFSNLEFSEKLTYMTYPILRFAELLYFLKPRNYITVSNWMKNQIKNNYPNFAESIKVIHNSVDTFRFFPKKSAHHKKVVLFTGRIIAAKGIKYLVDSIPTILKEFPETFFVFIGAGDTSIYRHRLSKLHVPNSNYEFIGYLKNTEDLIKYYQNASVYVAPTLYENLPIRILEAMACGVPVVASNVCAIPEAVENKKTGLLVTPGSSKELCENILTLLSDSTLCDELGKNSRQRIIEQFNWSVNTEKILDAYKSVLH